MKTYNSSQTALTSLMALFLTTALTSAIAQPQLILPFDPSAADQDTVLAGLAGIHGSDGQCQAAETYGGKIYYVINSDGSAFPSKVLSFDPATSALTPLASTAANQFWALKVMTGLLWISHVDGRLWTYNGSTLTEKTGTPFTAANFVSAMADFNGKMYFATGAGAIYESSDGLGFTLKKAFTPGKSIRGLTSWQGALYAANSEDYSYTAKIFRSIDGSTWVTNGVFSTYSFYGFMPTPTHLYLASVEDAGGASFAIRSTTDGTNWTRIFYTDTEGKGLAGRPTYFSQTGRAYFCSNWYYPSPSHVTRIFPAFNGTVESRTILRHGFASFVELNGQLYGIGAQAVEHWQFSPHVVSRLGKYTALNLRKAVYLDSSTLLIGTNYQLQVSGDLVNWTNHGAAFTATNANWRSANYWDVDNWGKLFFRFQTQ